MDVQVSQIKPNKINETLYCLSIRIELFVEKLFICEDSVWSKVRSIK